MNAQTKVEVKGLDLLRLPFPDHQISKLPKETKAQIDERKTNRSAMVFNCAVCGGHHHKNAVHLDYVGHAALTDRLLDADIAWSWEPVAFTSDGLPAFDRNNGLWIRLTIDGVTRLGYGSADGKSGGDAIKEIIGDALRNAAMRFGAALDLWHKGDLHLDEPEAEAAGGHSNEGEVSPPPAKQPAHSALKVAVRNLVHELEGCGDWDTYAAFRETPDFKKVVAAVQEKLPEWWDGGPSMPDEFVPLRRRIELTEANLAESKAQYLNA